MKVGIDIGWSHIAIGVVDNEYKIIEKVEKDFTQEDKNNIKQVIETFIIENIEQLKIKYTIESIGIAIPGTTRNGSILKAVNLGIKEKYKLQDILENRLHIPIKMDSDSKCSAIAEYKLGNLKGTKKALFLTLGTGIGGAVIINEKILDTEERPDIKIGHLIIEKNGRKCNCGNYGCLEKYASMKSFKADLREALEVTEKTTGKELLEILNSQNLPRKKKEEIQKIIERLVEYLTTGIARGANKIEPEVVELGGSFVFFKELLLPPIKEKLLNEKLNFTTKEKTRILPAVLGNDAGIIGATLI